MQPTLDGTTGEGILEKPLQVNMQCNADSVTFLYHVWHREILSLEFAHGFPGVGWAETLIHKVHHLRPSVQSFRRRVARICARTEESGDYKAGL